MDGQFPSRYNITELALDGMWGLCGTDVPFPGVVNIGPGILNASDCKDTAKKFSRGMKAPPDSIPQTETPQSLSSPTDPEGKRTPIPRRKTYSSEESVDIEVKLERRESEIEESIRKKLPRERSAILSPSAIGLCSKDGAG